MCGSSMPLCMFELVALCELTRVTSHFQAQLISYRSSSLYIPILWYPMCLASSYHFLHKATWHDFHILILNTFVSLQNMLPWFLWCLYFFVQNELVVMCIYYARMTPYWSILSAILLNILYQLRSSIIVTCRMWLSLQGSHSLRLSQLTWWRVFVSRTLSRCSEVAPDQPWTASPSTSMRAR